MAKTVSKNKSVKNFESLTRDYYDESFERFPLSGSGAGIAKFYDKMNRPTPKAFLDQLRLAKKTLDQLL